MPSYTIEQDGLAYLFGALQRRDYQLIGPSKRNGAIVYDELRSVDELPVGWTDEQDGGEYRLKKRDDDAYFGYVIGPQSWKSYLHPPTLRLWRAERDAQDGFKVIDEPPEETKFAFIGVRACELSAILVQDRVFMGGEYKDPDYQARREKAFILAVNCGQAGKTCFCASMNTGPKAEEGFDLALTEILDGTRHYFIVEVGSELGGEVLLEIPHLEAEAIELAAAAEATQTAVSQMGRELDTTNVKEILYRNYDNPYWEEVADRCLTCGNCTMVCPTCFCTTVEDVTDLTGQSAERVRHWDSCFTTDFSYIHGGSVRPSAKSRYRQWTTHKLGTWIDQFGSSGCVGCGRCITWCPVGIDITETMQVIRASDETEGGNVHG